MVRRYVCDKCGQDTSPVERMFCDNCGEEKKMDQMFSISIDGVIHVELCLSCAEDFESMFKRYKQIGRIKKLSM